MIRRALVLVVACSVPALASACGLIAGLGDPPSDLVPGAGKRDGAAGNGQPRVLASSQNAPFAIAVDATHVYFTNQGDNTVMRVAKQAEGAAVFASVGPDRIRGLMLDASAAYWVRDYVDRECSGQGSALVHAPKAGGSEPVTRMTLCGGSAVGLAVTATNAYFTHESGVARISLSTSGDWSSTGSVGTSPWALATDGAALYWTDLGDGAIRRTELDTESTVTLVENQHAYSIAADSSGIYFTTAAGAVIRLVRTDGTATPIVLAQNQSAPRGIALDGPDVFWVNAGDGTLRRVAKTGGSEQQLASGLSEPTQLDVDSSGIYWTNAGDGTVMMLAR